MRTTVNLDDNIYHIVKNMAREQDNTIGKIISDLVKKGLHAQRGYSSAKGFPVFTVSENTPPITLEDVKKDEDEW